MRLIRDDADLGLGGYFLDEAVGGLVQPNVGHAQLGGAGHPRDQRGSQDRGDEERGDLDPVGPLDDVRDRSVGEHQRNETEGQRDRAPATAPDRQRDRDGRRGHQDQHPGGVRPGLGVDTGPEDQGDREGDRRERQREGTGGPGPLRGHPIAGQVPGHDVQQPGHGRGAGEPQDADRAQVMGRPKPVAQVGMAR